MFDLLFRVTIHLGTKERKPIKGDITWEARKKKKKFRLGTVTTNACKPLGFKPVYLRKTNGSHAMYFFSQSYSELDH